MYCDQTSDQSMDDYLLLVESKKAKNNFVPLVPFTYLNRSNMIILTKYNELIELFLFTIVTYNLKVFATLNYSKITWGHF